MKSLHYKSLPTIVLVFSCLFLSKYSAFAQCTTIPQVNSVINGDFEAGYIASGPGSFNSDQMYVYDPANAVNSARMDAVIANPTGTPVLPCAWNSDGRFHVASYYGPFRCDGGNYNGHPFLSETDGRDDHTKGPGGGGRYLMIDSKNGPATGLGITLWEQDVNIIPNENYYFSAWFINFSPVSNGANRVQLRFVVEAFNASNVSLGVFQLGAVFSPADASRGNNWEQAFRTWVAPVGAVTARLGLYNQTANVINGNDVAIDDISFTNGCQDVTGNIPPQPSLGPSINICSTNGTITLNSNVATNVGAGRTFTWYSGTGNPQTQIGATSTTANTLNITAPGTYRVCVFEATGGACAKSSTIVVTESQTISLGNDETLCKPNASTEPLVSVLGNTGATYSYSWTRNGSAFPGILSTNTATTPGTYVVNATHPTRPACNATDTKIVTNTNTMSMNIGSNVNLCSSSNALFAASLTGTAFTYQWQRDGIDIPGATTSSYSATIPGVYRLNITHPVTGCNLTSSASVTNSNPVTANNANFCAPPAATVGLSVSGTGTFNWYDAATGGTLVQANSTTYTTPAISATTTYYVQDMTSASGTTISGMTAFGGADYYPTFASNEDAIPEGIQFTTLKNNVTLNSVDVFVQEYAAVSNVQIDVMTSTNVLIGSSAVVGYNNPGATAYRLTVPLGVLISTAGNYKLVFRMGIGGTGPLRAETSGYTGTDPTNTINVTGSNDDGRNYFRNLDFTAGSNPCGRLPVTAYLTGSCPAPVTLLSFVGENSNGVNTLSWTTTEEINASHYVLLKSTDGINFAPIGTIAATNNFAGISTYSFVDKTMSGSNQYYQLAQHDFDGTVHYSSIILITSKGGELSVYPNPSKGIFAITVSGVTGNVTIEITNSLGQVVYTELITSANGVVDADINISALSAGVYHARVKAENNQWSERLVKE